MIPARRPVVLFPAAESLVTFSIAGTQGVASAQHVTALVDQMQLLTPKPPLLFKTSPRFEDPDVEVPVQPLHDTSAGEATVTPDSS
jgi:hypothetical protein